MKIGSIYMEPDTRESYCVGKRGKSYDLSALTAFVDRYKGESTAPVISLEQALVDLFGADAISQKFTPVAAEAILKNTETMELAQGSTDAAVHAPNTVSPGGAPCGLTSNLVGWEVWL